MRCLKTEKSVLMIVFVQISARFSFDIMHKTTMVPFSTNLQVKWNALCHNYQTLEVYIITRDNT